MRSWLPPKSDKAIGIFIGDLDVKEMSAHVAIDIQLAVFSLHFQRQASGYAFTSAIGNNFIPGLQFRELGPRAAIDTVSAHLDFPFLPPSTAESGWARPRTVSIGKMCGPAKSAILAIPAREELVTLVAKQRAARAYMTCLSENKKASEVKGNNPSEA
jgi:hypothetical protein